jgi:hypothetical protein
MKKKIVNILLIVSLVIMVYLIGRGIYWIVNDVKVAYQIPYPDLLTYHEFWIRLDTNIVHTILFVFIFVSNIIILLLFNKNEIALTKEEILKRKQENKRKKLENKKKKIEEQLNNIK